MRRLRPAFGALAAAILALVATAAAALAQTHDTTGMVRTRMRVIGVFDRQTGQPLDGVEVRDFNSGLTALTTRTGTVALLLEDTLGTLIRIKKVGYTPQTLMVGTAVKDTIPLTVDLLRAGMLLEKVIVTANGRTLRLGPRDTVQTLLENGFYERRASSAASADAFITGDNLRATVLLSDARFFGRPICESNVYVDGMPMNFVDGAAPRAGVFTHEGIDAFIDPSQIAGIETYRFGDLPASTTNTFAGDRALSGLGASSSFSAIANGLNSATVTGCVTLIWLKR
jgi:hypothetical protein